MKRFPFWGLLIIIIVGLPLLLWNLPLRKASRTAQERGASRAAKPNIVGQPSVSGKTPVPENHDIRTDSSQDSRTKLARQKLARQQSARNTAQAQSMSGAQSALALRIGVRPWGRPFPAAPSDLTRALITRSSLARSAAAYGFSPAQAGQLPMLARLTKPAGNFAQITRAQRFNGLPVFADQGRADLTPSGEVMMAVNRLAYSQSVFNRAPLPATIHQPRPSQTNTREQLAKDSPVAPAESRVELANLPQKKGPEFRTRSEMTIPTTATTNAAPGEVNESIALQNPPSSIQAEISAPATVVPAEFRGDLRNLPQRITPEERKLFARPFELEVEPSKNKQALPGAKPAVLTPLVGPLAPMPNPTVSFNGMDYNTNGAGHPPDTVGDVGPNHFIQAVNTSIGIYNKTGGPAITTFTFNSLWSGAGTGTPCDTSHQGDPTVIYSTQYDRFIVADFSWTNIQNGPYYECIAVSKTSNPVTGGWWLYAVRADDAAHPWLPDYPKMGIWPDGLYMAANMFDCTTATCSSATYKEARAYAFNIVDLVNGAPLHTLVADTNSANRFTLLPSNFRGTPPPAGRENLMVAESNTAFAWEVYKFHADFAVPANSTFTGPINVSQTAYTGAADIVPALAPGNNMDTLADRAMMQNQYRNIAGIESLWVNHTTGTANPGGSSTPTGIQWAQINVTGGTINTTPVQQQIYNNGADGLNRFMGALAVDNLGNMALGYTASSSAVAPDIRYAGRLSTDPLNNLPQTEVTLLQAVARSVQTGNCGGSPCTRWGDYSTMTIDPVDDCTFWYTNMYFPVQGTNWVTRIGSFRFPTCSPASLTIATVAPLAGRASGGQAIKLTGLLANLSSITIGGVSAPTWFFSIPTSEVTVTTPVHAVGAVDIVVTPTSGSPYTKTNAFAYLPTVFTDDTLTVGVTTAKPVHITELRQAVDALRIVAGLGPATWTDPTLTPTSTVIKAVHITELRSKLEEVALLLGYSPPGSYTDAVLNSSVPIKRVHIQELRQRIRIIAG